MRRHPVIKPNTDALTKREEDILSLIREGVLRSDMAARLCICKNNISAYLLRLQSKGAIRRVGVGKYVIAQNRVSGERPQKPVLTESSIAPIPLSRLMGAR